MYNTIEIREAEKKDYFDLKINGVILGSWERSALRQLIETVDNAI